MQKIDRQKFFDSYRASYGSLSQATVNGLEALLGFLEADDKVTDLRHAAYMLATIKRECGNTFKPVKEVGQGKGKEYGKPDPVTGKVYFGRGYTQNTWKENYQMLTNAWNKAHPDRKIDFVYNPDLLLVPEYSYFAMSYGMRNGTFTGVGLNRYIHGDVCDFVNARRIINGTDKAELIAGYANKFLEAITSSVV